MFGNLFIICLLVENEMNQLKEVSIKNQAPKSLKDRLQQDTSTFYSKKYQIQNIELYEYNFFILENVSHNVDLAKYLFELLRTQCTIPISIFYKKVSTPNKRTKKTQLWLKLQVMIKNTTVDAIEEKNHTNHFQKLIRQLITGKIIPIFIEFIKEYLHWEKCLNDDEEANEISEAFRSSIIEPVDMHYQNLLSSEEYNSFSNNI